jgi:hypothetical protein
MKINALRKLVLFKRFLKNTKNATIFAFETIICIVCCLFITGLICIVLYGGYLAFIEYEIIRKYIAGILTLMAIALSVTYINIYNKKYRKNDSNSPKGQNDFFLEDNIRGFEGHYVNRRNLE